MSAAASLARNTTSGATLSGSRSVPTAASLGHLPVCSKNSRPRGVESIIRVAPLGRMALAVMPYLASALAVDQVSPRMPARSEEHTSELQSRLHLVCRLLLEKKKKKSIHNL